MFEDEIWSCGAPATTIPNALRPKEEEIFDVNSENFRHNNANELFLPLNRALLHCISLIQERCPEIGWYRRQQKRLSGK